MLQRLLPIIAVRLKKMDDDFLNTRQRNIEQWNALSKSGGALIFEGAGDASMKKNMALVKRLKLISKDSAASIIQEIGTLKSDKFVDELVKSVLENRWKKNTDIKAAAQVCEALHKRYAGFFISLSRELTSMLTCPSKSTVYANNEEKDTFITNRVNSQRTFFKFYIELFILGVIGSGSFLVQALKHFILFDMQEMPTNFYFLGLLDNIAKAYKQLFFQVPLSDDEVAAEYSAIFHANQKEVFLGEFKKYFDFLRVSTIKSHERLKSLEKSQHEYYMTRGDLNEDQKARYEAASQLFDKLYGFLISLATTLGGLEVPSLEKGTSELGVRMSSGLIVVGHSGDMELLQDDDEVVLKGFSSIEEKSFYEDIPSLEYIPSNLLGPHYEKIAAVRKRKEHEALGKFESLQENFEILLEQERLSGSFEIQETDDGIPDDIVTVSSELALPEDEPLSANMKIPFQAFMDKLMMIGNRENLDKLIVEFLYINNKGTRKRLVAEMHQAIKLHPDSLPFMYRLLAAIHPYFPDLYDDMLLPGIEKDFRLYCFLNKKVMSANQKESRFKLTRAISELVKFRLFSQGTIFLWMKRLLDDFTGNNVEIFCYFLELAGRILYLREDSRDRIALLVDIMQKKKLGASPPFPASILATIENAYFCVFPQANNSKEAIQRIEKSPIERYLNYLFYVKLSKETLPAVVAQLLKMPWQDGAFQALFYKYYKLIGRVKFSQTPLLAAILLELTKYYPDLVKFYMERLVDDCVRAGLESDNVNKYQKRLATMRFLGDCCNVGLLDPSVILSLLYVMVTFGHLNNFPVPSSTSPLDPSGYTFRIRLICMLLVSCPTLYLSRQWSHQLDCFLRLFQYYILTKDSIHAELEFLITDSFDIMRPRWRLATDLFEALQLLGSGKTLCSPFVETNNSMNTTTSASFGSSSSDKLSATNDKLSTANSCSSISPETTRNHEAELESMFDQEFTKMISSSLEERHAEPMKKYLSIDIPLYLTATSGNTPAIPGSPCQLERASSMSEKHAFSYSVLVKRKNKPTMRPISMPFDSTIVQNTMVNLKESENQRNALKSMILKQELSNQQLISTGAVGSEEVLPSRGKQFTIPRRQYTSKK